MMVGMDVAAWSVVVEVVATLGVAVAALRQWRASSRPEALWVMGSFATTAIAVVAADAIIPVAAWLLYRFAAGFGGSSRPVEILVSSSVAGAAAATVAAAPDGIGAAAMLVVAALTVWRLWALGRGQPNLPRHRLRTMATGAAGLMSGLILVLGGEAATIGSFAVFAGSLVFGLGLSPPSILRALWLRPEEAQLQDTARELMAATSRDEVASRLLISAARAVGASAAVLLDEHGHAVSTFGASARMVREVEEEGAGSGQDGASGRLCMRLALRTGWLVVWADPLTPFFGSEEFRMLRTTGMLADLALGNVDRLELERALVAELQRAIDARRDFFAFVTHEFGSPLASIRGFATLLRGRADQLSSDERGRYLSRIEDVAGELARLVDQLLDASASETGRLRAAIAPVDLAAVVERAVEAMETLLAGRVRVDVPDLRVLADPLLLGRTLTNLLANAAKYAPDSTPIDVTAVRSDDVVRVEVRDRGRGLEAREAENVFEPFWRSDTARAGAVRGSGVGLSLVREYVDLMGGAVGVESVPGEGSTFFFTLKPGEPPGGG